jgi:hypothetical protein
MYLPRALDVDKSAELQKRGAHRTVFGPDISAVLPHGVP